MFDEMTAEELAAEESFNRWELEMAKWDAQEVKWLESQPGDDEEGDCLDFED